MFIQPTKAIMRTIRFDRDTTPAHYDVETGATIPAHTVVTASNGHAVASRCIDEHTAMRLLYTFPHARQR